MSVAGRAPGATPARALFGTDGVRGVAGADLTPELALALGRGLAARLDPGARVLVGRDTRRSGPMLEAALSAGLAGGGVDVVSGGVLPTPAVAELVASRDDLAAGAVISASHNPFPDNGIKVFGGDGFKLSDTEEAEVEAAMEDPPAGPTGAGVGCVEPWPGAAAEYVEALLARFPLDLAGMRIAVDCANGATVATAPAVLARLGADLDLLAAAPDGVNINVGSGSTDLGHLQAAVRRGGHDLGIAFDGDGDRVLAVDHTGAAVDGDQVLAVCALWLRARGELPGPAVVTTTMTNLGFRRAMAAEGIEVRWTDVGDRYVLEEMRASGLVLGGEPSGHLINLRSGPTGDGLATALLLLGALGERGVTLAEAASVVRHLPQRLVSVRVARKRGLPDAGEVWDLVRACEAELGEDGRVVVRASGTEPLVRVMVEAPSAEACERWCRDIAGAAERALGAGTGEA